MDHQSLFAFLSSHLPELVWVFFFFWRPRDSSPDAIFLNHWQPESFQKWWSLSLFFFDCVTSFPDPRSGASTHLCAIGFSFFLENLKFAVAQLCGHSTFCCDCLLTTLPRSYSMIIFWGYFSLNLIVSWNSFSSEFIGLSVYQSIGLSVYRSVGLSVYREGFPFESHGHCSSPLNEFCRKCWRENECISHFIWAFVSLAMIFHFIILFKYLQAKEYPDFATPFHQTCTRDLMTVPWQVCPQSDNLRQNFQGCCWITIKQMNFDLLLFYFYYYWFLEKKGEIGKFGRLLVYMILPHMCELVLRNAPEDRYGVRDLHFESICTPDPWK